MKHNLRKVLFLVILLFNIYSFSTIYSLESSEPNIDQSITEKEELPMFKENLEHEFTSQVKLIDNELRNKTYSQALASIQTLYHTVKSKLESDINIFFPSTFRNYKTSKSEQLTSEFEERSYGVIFVKSYKDKRGRTIDVNVIYADESIHEYERLIDSPNLVKGIDNVQIVNLYDKYKAIQKSSVEQSFYEFNIVVNRDLLINIIGVGMSDIEVIHTFSKTINIAAIENYLN